MFYVIIQLKHRHIWIWWAFNSSRTDNLLHITNNRGVVITIITMVVFQNKWLILESNWIFWCNVNNSYKSLVYAMTFTQYYLIQDNMMYIFKSLLTKYVFVIFYTWTLYCSHTFFVDKQRDMMIKNNLTNVWSIWTW